MTKVFEQQKEYLENKPNNLGNLKLKKLHQGMKYSLHKAFEQHNLMILAIFYLEILVHKYKLNSFIHTVQLLQYQVNMELLIFIDQE